MKKVLFFIIALLITLTSNGFERGVVFYHEEPICFYETPYGVTPKYVLQCNFDNDLAYNVKIVDSSEFRYKVLVEGVLGPEYSSLFVAWTDKINCGVWLRAQKYVDGVSYIVLYETPDEQSPSIDIPWDGLSYGIVMDYNDQNWVKILIDMDGKSVVGWVNSYCDSIYNSCN